VITKPEEHEINRTGKRLLREALEPLKWVVNDVQEDYGIDCNIQVFDGKSPTGEWFHVQLKSSASTSYAADRTFLSQELSIDHARHYALEMRQSVVLIHADVTSRIVYWYTPQLDRLLPGLLRKADIKSVTVRIPTRQQLPDTAHDLLTSLDKIHLALAIRTLNSTPTQFFAESLTHFPDQGLLYRNFHEKNDTLKLRIIYKLFEEKKYDQARSRTESVMGDPDSTLEVKFWAQLQLLAIDYVEAVHSGKPQGAVARLRLSHAKSLQKLTKSGPKYLKFYSLIAKHAAELEILAHENFSLFMAIKQHLEEYGNPLIAIGLYARRLVLTRRIVAEYNRCLRLARYAANYPDRWVLGRALTNVVTAMGSYLVTLRAEDEVEVEKTFAHSTFQICKLAAWISEETGDSEGVVLAILSALMTTHSTDSDAYRWAKQVAESLVDQEIRVDALLRIERATRRWKGESVEGDYQGDTVWQIFQNMATALHIDIRDENSPLVRGLRIAAKDNTPERVLRTCEHIVATPGAIGPIARHIAMLFNTQMAGSKIIHCALHDYHHEARDFDSTLAEFKLKHCDSCPDRTPRPPEWEFTEAVRREFQAKP
jgi:hypothetical protein